MCRASSKSRNSSLLLSGLLWFPVDIVVIIKKVKNIKEKLHKANENEVIKKQSMLLICSHPGQKIDKYCIKVISNYLVANFRYTPLYGWYPGQKHLKTDQNPLKTK